MTLLNRFRSERGLAATELALVIPVFLILATLVAPLVKAGWEYHVLTRATSHGVRYATRTDANARTSTVGLTRRPTADEVEAFVKDAADPLDADAVTVSVSPEPASSLPGERITVTATYEMSFGPLAELANGVRTALFGGDALFPESTTVTVSAWGREE